MGPLAAASRTLSAVKRNPVLFVVALAIALGSGAVTAAWQIPYAGVFVGLLFGIAFFFVEPFLSGGLLGMGREALRGETEMETFVETGKRVYLRLLAARLFVWVASIVYFGLFFVVAILALVAFLVVGAGVGADADAALAAIGLLAVLLFLGGLALVTVIYYLIGFVVQFHPAAIVVEDVGLVESIKRSVSLVRSNLLGAVGYTVLVLLVSYTIGAIPGVYITVTGGFVDVLAQEDPELFVGLGLLNAVIYFGLFVLIQTLLLPFLRVFHVAFYVDAMGLDDETPANGDRGTPTGGDWGTPTDSDQGTPPDDDWRTPPDDDWRTPPDDDRS